MASAKLQEEAAIREIGRTRADGLDKTRGGSSEAPGSTRATAPGPRAKAEGPDLQEGDRGDRNGGA
eukprot:499271-Pyramimonas_sp.AAC.1